MNEARDKMVNLALRSESEQQTLALAQSMAARLRGGDVLALEGPLGSGKTCFVRGLAEGLGIDASCVSSPTFVIRHEYGGGATPTLVHIDAYRLSSPDDLESIGWHELVADHTAIIAIEWPSRVSASLPHKRIDISFAHVGEHVRSITMTGPASIVNGLTDVPAPSSAIRKCRTCGRPIDASPPTSPFCSDRCRLADLGRWFNERYRTSRAVEADEELSE